jgi:RecQ-mediated genome instability protein 1
MHWQVDEILNITCPLQNRYQEAPPGLKRCLKLSMTDGIQRVFGMEYRPIKALEVCASSGLKVSSKPFFSSEYKYMPIMLLFGLME